MLVVRYRVTSIICSDLVSGVQEEVTQRFCSLFMYNPM